MEFLSVAEIAELWGVSERSVRNYCAQGLVMFKECLANGVVPFIIADDMKAFYYRGLSEWDTEKGYLTDTCLAAQDRFKAELDYFRIAY